MGTLDRNVSNYEFCRRNYTPILPLVYSDALSYIETLGQFSAKLNEVIEAMNGLETETLDLAKAYTDEAIKKQLQTIDEAVAEVHALYAELQRQNAQFQTNVNATLAIFRNDINNIGQRVDSAVKVANEYTNFAILQNNEYIIEETTKRFSTVKVVNYFTGERVSVQDMFDYLAQFHLQNAINYNQLVTRDKTYNQLIAYDMSYTDLALNGGTIIQ